MSEEESYATPPLNVVGYIVIILVIGVFADILWRLLS